jgi:hypothetical protein
MRAVCAFLNEPFCDDVLRINLLPSSADIRALTVSTTRIVSANAEKWRAQMSRADRDLFASVAGDLLEELGYEAAGLPRRISAIERTMWRVHHAAVRSSFRLRVALSPAYARTSWEFLRARTRRQGRTGSMYRHRVS